MIESVKAWEAHPKPRETPPTSDLVKRLRTAAQELLTRAHAKQPDAITKLCSFTHNLVYQLNNLGKKHRDNGTRVASTFEEWPILYAPDNRNALDPYKDLKVGTDSFIPRYAGRKIPYDQNLWTQYADAVLRLCRLCKKPWPLRAPCRKWREPTIIKVGTTEIRIYYYHTPDGIFEIPEWCEWCRDLPNKLTRETIDKFWKPARMAILEFWAAAEFWAAKNKGATGSYSAPHSQPSNVYRDALKQAPRGKHGLESERRNNALNAIKKAMISLAGK